MAEALKGKKGRITIYAEQQERQELLKKVLEYTQANSISEAIFAALSELMEYKEKQYKDEGAKILAECQGMWADDPRIAEAFETIAQRWEDWEIERY